MGIGSILGGIAGLLIPGGGALFSSIGSGLGSLLIDKESPKDAIKNALFAGLGAKILGPSITKNSNGSKRNKRFSSFRRRNVSRNRKCLGRSGTSGGYTSGGSSKYSSDSRGLSAGQIYGGLLRLGAVSDMTRKPNQGTPKFFSYHTGTPFDTMEEASAEDRRFEQKMGFSYPMGQMPQPTTPFAQGGYIEGPGTGTSDSIPAVIKQDGVPVQEAALSDGEFVMTEAAVKGAGNGDRKQGAANMYAMMRDFERGQA